MGACHAGWFGLRAMRPWGGALSSAILYVAIVAIWAVVLVPRWLRLRTLPPPQAVPGEADGALPVPDEADEALPVPDEADGAMSVPDEAVRAPGERLPAPGWGVSAPGERLPA